MATFLHRGGLDLKRLCAEVGWIGIVFVQRWIELGTPLHKDGLNWINRLLCRVGLDWELSAQWWIGLESLYAEMDCIVLKMSICRNRLYWIGNVCAQGDQI